MGLICYRCSQWNLFTPQLGLLQGMQDKAEKKQQTKFHPTVAYYTGIF